MTQETRELALPPIPSLSVTRVFRIREKIRLSSGVIGLLGESLSVGNLTDLFDAIKPHLPGVDSQVLWTSLLPFQGEVLDEKLAMTLAWRLAGNIHRLSENLLLRPWTAQQEDEWMAFQVLEVQPGERTRRGGSTETAAWLELKTLAGSHCTRTSNHWWTLPYCRFVAARLGFDRSRRPKYPYVDLRQLAGLRFWGYVEARPFEPVIRISQIEVPASLRTDNRRLIKSRARDGSVDFTCPEGYPSSSPCHTCPAGIDRCPVAVHRRTYLFAPCRNCGNGEAPFDGNLLAPKCLDCTNKERK